MTRTQITDEINRIEGSRPTTGAFASSRADRLAALREQLATATDTQPDPMRDPAYLACVEAADAASPANRRRARWS